MNDDDGAVAHRLPGASQSRDISLGACSAIGDGVQLPLDVAGQVRTLGQVLAQRAIGILVGPTLPGAVRISKEYLDREAVC
jgi:hypothetical protein